jgi:hypothetical protein
LTNPVGCPITENIDNNEARSRPTSTIIELMTDAEIGPFGSQLLSD